MSLAPVVTVVQVLGRGLEDLLALWEIWPRIHTGWSQHSPSTPYSPKREPEGSLFSHFPSR